MKRITALALVVLLFFSCNVSTQSSESEKETPKTTEKIEIQVFDEWPEEIQGCSCYSSRNQSEFEKNQFIYVNNYEDLTLMQINGQVHRFTKTKEERLSSDTHYRQTFKSDDFELIIETKQVSRSDETFQHEGTLILKATQGEVVELKIYGECGC